MRGSSPIRITSGKEEMTGEFLDLIETICSTIISEVEKCGGVTETSLNVRQIGLVKIGTI